MRCASRGQKIPSFRAVLPVAGISLLQGLAFGVFYTLLGLPLGRLADRMNRSNLIAIGMAFWCLMTVACGLSSNFGQLFVARM